MNKKINCINHIGTEKTGTSSIQSHFYKNKSIYLEKGLLYPTLPSKDASQYKFVGAVADIDKILDIADLMSLDTKNDQEALGVWLRENLEDQLYHSNKTTPETLIISSEHFHSRLTTVDAVAKLKLLLAPYVKKYTVVMYVRRQTEMASSFYSTRLKSGQYDIDVLPDITVDKTLKYYFNLYSIYANWKAVFGIEAMDVGIYEREALYKSDIVRDFCKRLNFRLNLF